MKNLFLILMFVMLHGAPSCSMAQTTPNTQTIFEGIDSRQNYIKNPYARLSDLNVTCTNATKARDGVTNKLYGAASLVIDASAQNGYCEFALKPILGPDDSGNCEFKGVFKGDGTLYRAQILDGSSVVKAQTLPLKNETNWRAFSVNAPCQATPKVRLTQTEAGTAPAVSVGVYYGKATNIGSGTPPNTFTAKVSPTGVVSDETGMDWINGNFTIASTVLFSSTFASGTFTSIPTCFLSTNDGNGTVPNGLRIAVLSTSGITVQSQNSSGATAAFNLSCTKTGADFVQPAITAQNYNFSDRVFTPTVSGQGSGSATVNSATLSRNGTKATICLRATKDATAGTGGATVSFSMPSGITAVMPSGQASFVGSGFAVIAGTSNFSLATSGSNLFFYLGGGFFAGSSWIAGADINGCVTFPAAENGVPWTETQNAQQLTGSVTSDDPNNAYKEFYAYSNSCSGSSCAISSREGSAISSIARGGAGNYSAVLTGLSSAPLWCDCQSVGANDQTCHAYNLTSSGVGNIRTYAVGTTTLQESNQLRLWCKVAR